MSSEDVSIVQMNNVKRHATTVHQDDQQCINGIKAETTLPLNDHKSPTGTMSLVSSPTRGCALVAPGGPCSFTFAPRGLGLENLVFLQKQSGGLPGFYMFGALDSFQFFLRAQPCQKLTFKFVCIALCFHKGSRGEGWDSCATRYIRSLWLLSGANVSNALLITTHFLRNPQCAHATIKEQINPSSPRFHCRSVLP